MNILIDLLPETVLINDKVYEINSDFRTSILFEILMQDNKLSELEKLKKGLELYYPVIPVDVKQAIEQIMWFFSNGKENNKSSKSAGSNSNKNIYSFDYDADYILSAFLDQYGVDLNEVDYLHWWKFKAMFNGLKSDNRIVEIMGYRGTDVSEIKDKDQKDFYRKMQELYKIPVKYEIEKINDIEEALLNGGDISKLL